MSQIFKRQSAIVCFFCQSPVAPYPPNPRAFRCPNCKCLNQYDGHGEIVSDEPAMHDEELNRRSFARRASVRKDRFPTTYGPGPFCHTCQTNQMLIINLLSSYLPPPESPDYDQRLQDLPQYRESLHSRYPPVCENCAPGVEEEIRQKDHMARTQALGGWLQDTRGREKERRVPEAVVEEGISSEMLLWRVRGGLWCFSFVISCIFNLSASFGYRPFYFLSLLQPVFPIFVLSSVLWVTWDPTYSSFKQEKRQGRDVRVLGKREYTFFQMTAWSARLITSILLWINWYSPQTDYLQVHNTSSNFARIYFTTVTIIELSVQVLSISYLSLKHPPAVRLIETQTHRFPSRAGSPHAKGPGSRGATPSPSPSHFHLPFHLKSPRSSSAPVSRQVSLPRPSRTPESDLLASLSLSSKPIITTPKSPVFGLTSFLPQTNQNPDGENVYDDDDDMEEENDTDSMDWTSTDSRFIKPSSSSSHKRTPKEKQKTKPPTNDNIWLRPQRFFAPETPTGLEGLFANTKLDDDTFMEDGTRQNVTWNLFMRRHWRQWWWMYVCVIGPLVVAVWLRRLGYLNISSLFTRRIETSMVDSSPISVIVKVPTSPSLSPSVSVSDYVV